MIWPLTYCTGKDACGVLNDICQSSSSTGDNNELCNGKLSSCLGSDKVSAPSVSCIKSAEQSYLNGTADNVVCSSKLDEIGFVSNID